MKNFKKSFVSIFILIFSLGSLFNAVTLASTNTSSDERPFIYTWSPSEGWKQKYPQNNKPSYPEATGEKVDYFLLQPK